MNSNYQVIVLSPVGRRTTIKVTPGTSILQIIEEACAKQKLDSSIYDLKHLRRVLDTSSTIKFSNVPNKAQLELVEASIPRKEGFVTVNLVTEAGLRLMADFSSKSSLLDILNYHAKEGNIDIPDEESGVEPIVVYTMRRICGKELSTISLKSLGLLNGKCMLRYNKQNKTSSGPSQANVSGPLIQPKKIPSVAKPDECSQSTSVNELEIPLSKPPLLPVTESVVSEPAQDASFAASTCQPKEIEDCEATSMNQCRDNSLNDFIRSPLPPLVDSNLSTSIEDDQMELDNINEEKPELSPSISAVEASTITFEPKDPKIVKLGSHDAILFNWDDAPITRMEPESDDFFELTVSEVKKLYREKVQGLREFDEVPLMTQSMKQLEKDSRLLSAMNQHPVTQLRICFPDRNVIQASFKPRNTILQVMNFIRPFLVDTDMEFSLYTIMPKRTLDPDLSLVDADCIPKARLFFDSCSNIESNSSYLSEETLAKRSSFEAASNQIVVSKSTKAKFEHQNGPSISGVASTSSASTSSTVRPSETSTKKPKWFKLGK